MTRRADDVMPLPDGGGEGIRLGAAQRRVMANKAVQGFNTTDVKLELCLLQGEIAEFFHAWRRGQPHAGEELADVVIYVLGVAGIAGVDLETEIATKMRVNERRRYQARDGVMTRLPDSDDGPETPATRPGAPREERERGQGWER